MKHAAGRKKILMAVRMYCSTSISMPPAMKPTQRTLVSSIECTYSFSQFNLAIRKADGNIKKLTPRNSILFQQPTVSQLVKKFSTFYGTWRLMTAKANHILSNTHAYRPNETATTLLKLVQNGRHKNVLENYNIQFFQHNIII